MLLVLASIRRPAAVVVLGTLAACAGRRQTTPAPSAPSTAVVPDSSPPAHPTTRPAPASVDWLTVDSATHTASLTLEVTAPPNSPSAQISGFRAGAARIMVPLGWKVQWTWRNADPTSLHSLVVMVQREKIPLEGGRPAFSNAMTRMVTEGLTTGQIDRTTFEAEEPGWYWLLCGVPGHALKGEWIELRVDPEAATARVEAR
ncbi:MAG: sulfocyanin-like copper-binding protein [Gemmatimonadales bacterium]